MIFEMTRRAAFLGVAGGAVGGGVANPARPKQVSALESEAFTLPGSVVLDYRSTINGVDYRMFIRPPQRLDGASDPCPVVVTLDADYSFPICAAQLEHLAARGNQAPDAVLVSMAYAGPRPDPHGYRLNRTRDYTPVHVAEGGYGPDYQRESGGAAQFLRSLLEEALPLVDARWGGNALDRTLVGHSFGGLFAAWTLQTRPEAFRRYLMVSPSLWYADDYVLQNEAAGNYSPTKGPTGVFLAVGDHEEQANGVGHSMVSQMQTFASALASRGDPDLRVRHRVFEDETHASIFPAAFSTGIRTLFAEGG